MDYKIRDGTIKAIRLVQDIPGFGKSGDWLVINGKNQSVMSDKTFNELYEPVTQQHECWCRYPYYYPYVTWTSNLTSTDGTIYSSKQNPNSTDSYPITSSGSTTTSRTKVYI